MTLGTVNEQDQDASGRWGDLHLHSSFSDGTYSPEEIIREALAAGLTTVSLTDHDTVEGWPRLAQAGRARGVECIPGTELTAEVDGREMHLLGYFIDPAHRGLLQAMEQFQDVRRQRIVDIAAKLQSLGVAIEADAILDLADCRAPGRPHVARALVAAGLCSSLDEAFERFLKRDRPAWVPKFRMAAEDAIRLVHEAGGLAVLAHPVLNRVDRQIPRLADAGLDGLECFHTKHNASVAGHYLRLAEHLGLAITGGSDCHGLNKGKPLIGTVRLAETYLDRLRQRAAAAPRACDPPAVAPVKL
jgi:hypothetical protein